MLLSLPPIFSCTPTPSLLTVTDGDKVREWLGRYFVRPLSKGVDQASRCIRAMDLALGENTEFDQMVIMCLRRKAAQYIRKYAGAKQRGGIPLQDELLLAEGHKCGAFGTRMTRCAQ